MDQDNIKEEALIFPTPCHVCGLMGENNMCTIAVPYFKELIIMAFNCDKCGAKSREVKVGGYIFLLISYSTHLHPLFLSCMVCVLVYT